MKFRNWFENLQSERQKQLQQIWGDTFKALGVGGLADEDAAQQSLSKITFGQRRPDQGQNTFKGKQAVRKRLENGQIFSRLQQIGDPQLKQAVEDARRWLDTQGPENDSNASTTVSTLLQKLFGPKYFQQFIDSDAPRPDQAKAQVEPQLPKDSMGGEIPGPQNSMNMNNIQPQNTPQPTSPMPQKPANAGFGSY